MLQTFTCISLLTTELLFLQCLHLGLNLPYATLTQLFTAYTPLVVGGDEGSSPPQPPAQPFPASHSIGKGIWPKIVYKTNFFFLEIPEF
jgi:hypothetical protein